MTSSMRLLFLNHNVAWQGGFLRAYHWGRYLARKGHQVTVLTISEEKRWGFETQEREGVRLIKSPDLLTGRLRSGWDPWDTLNRIAYLLPQEFDLIHSVDSRPVCILPALLLKKLRKTKLVLDWGDWWGRGGTIVERSDSLVERLFAPVETFFEEAFRRYADGSVVLTSALKKRALALGVNEDQIIQIPHGADIERFVPREKGDARHRLGLQQDGLYLGYLGRITFKKDRELLMESCKILRRLDERIRLLLIGRSGITAGDINSDVRPSIILTNEVSYDELQDYVAACDIMLLPLKDTLANRGRWPSKIGDYLAAGRPVAACGVGDLERLFSVAPIGVLSRDDPLHFAQTILNLLGSPDLSVMGKNARQVAETELAWEILTDRLESYYLEVLNSRN